MSPFKTTKPTFTASWKSPWDVFFKPVKNKEERSEDKQRRKALAVVSKPVVRKL